MRALRLARRYGKMLIVTGWVVYMTYALVSGEIDVKSAFEKLISSEIITIIFGLM